MAAAAGFRTPEDFYEIWLGSELPENEYYHFKSNLLRWMKLYTQLNFHLVIDSKAISGTPEEKKIALDNIIKFCNDNKIILHDLSNDEYISYKIFGEKYGKKAVELVLSMLHPENLGKTPEEKAKLINHPFFKNYGGASDLLRYMILDNVGGIYCDCDNVPGTTKAFDLSQITLSHGIIFGRYIQSSAEVNGELISLPLFHNSFLIALPNCEFLKRFIEFAVDEFTKYYEGCLPSWISDQDTRDRETFIGLKQNFTVGISGPYGLREQFVNFIADKETRLKYHIDEEGYKKLETYRNAIRYFDDRLFCLGLCFDDLLTPEGLVEINSAMSWVKDEKYLKTTNAYTPSRGFWQELFSPEPDPAKARMDSTC